MNGEHARLLTRRAKAAMNTEHPRDWRDLVHIYARVSEAAYRGNSQVVIHTGVNDAMAQALREQGFVVRTQSGYGVIKNTYVEWGDQAVWNADNQSVSISPSDYNLNWERYERQRNQRSDS